MFTMKLPRMPAVWKKTKSLQKPPKNPSTHPRIIKEWRDHEGNDNDTQTIEPDEKEYWEVVGILKDSEAEEQHDRHKCQEGHKDCVDDKPCSPKDRIS